MRVTKEMIGAAHDQMLMRGDFIVSGRLIEDIYTAMRYKEPLDNKEAIERQVIELQEQLTRQAALLNQCKEALEDSDKSNSMEYSYQDRAHGLAIAAIAAIEEWEKGTE